MQTATRSEKSAPILRPLIGRRVNLLEENLRVLREAAAEAEKAKRIANALELQKQLDAATRGKIVTVPKAAWQHPKVVFVGTVAECKQKIQGFGAGNHRIVADNSPQS